MSNKNRYKKFLDRFMAKGALGVSLGLSAIAPISTNSQTPAERSPTISFSERLSELRSAVSDHLNQPLIVAQAGPHTPPPAPPPRPKPFTDAFRKQPPPKGSDK